MKQAQSALPKRKMFYPTMQLLEMRRLILAFLHHGHQTLSSEELKDQLEQIEQDLKPRKMIN